jgi:maleamate amidohydrolase
MEHDDIYRQQGFAGRLGLGEAPALLVIDFAAGFTDPTHFGGGNIGDAVARTVERRSCRN